jgi:hypothetical protein
MGGGPVEVGRGFERRFGWRLAKDSLTVIWKVGLNGYCLGGEASGLVVGELPVHCWVGFGWRPAGAL